MPDGHSTATARQRHRQLSRIVLRRRYETRPQSRRTVHHFILLSLQQFPFFIVSYSYISLALSSSHTLRHFVPKFPFLLLLRTLTSVNASLPCRPSYIEDWALRIPLARFITGRTALYNYGIANVINHVPDQHCIFRNKCGRKVSPWLLWKANRKPHQSFWMASVSITLSDL